VVYDVNKPVKYTILSDSIKINFLTVEFKTFTLESIIND